jgi:hypothetical protein
MAHYCPAFTATPFIHVDGLMISSATGEIFGYDDKPSVFSECPDQCPELSSCRSVDDLSAFLKHKLIDLRKLPAHTLHSLIYAQDIAHGVWRKLHGLVKYHGVIIISQADLANALNTTESNLMKKLNTLVDANMLRVHTSRGGDIRKGEIKLAINPRLIFRGSDKARDRYIAAWYRPTGYLHTGALRPFSVDECLAVAA